MNAALDSKAVQTALRARALANQVRDITAENLNDSEIVVAMGEEGADRLFHLADLLQDNVDELAHCVEMAKGETPAADAGPDLKHERDIVWENKLAAEDLAYRLAALASAVDDHVHAEATGEAPTVGESEFIMLTTMLREHANALTTKIDNLFVKDGAEVTQ